MCVCVCFDIISSSVFYQFEEPMIVELPCNYASLPNDWILLVAVYVFAHCRASSANCLTLLVIKQVIFSHQTGHPQTDKIHYMLHVIK